MMEIEQWIEQVERKLSFQLYHLDFQKPKLSLYESISSILTKQTPKGIVEFEEQKRVKAEKKAEEVDRIKRQLQDAIRRAEEEPAPAVDEYGVNSVNFWFFKGYVYSIENIRRHQHYSQEQIQLLILEFFDKERRKFEKLMHLYKSDTTQLKPYRRERIPEHVRIAVWRRDGGKCAHCSSREKLEYDHIVPISKGGGNTERNIELLCERCNREKSNRIQ